MHMGQFSMTISAVAGSNLSGNQQTEEDQLSWLMGVKGKLMENATLAQQAGSNQKEQFDNSPALKTAIMDAIIEALDAHSAMSRQALGSQEVQADLKAALMGPGRLYEELRERAA